MSNVRDSECEGRGEEVAGQAPRVAIPTQDPLLAPDYCHGDFHTSCNTGAVVSSVSFRMSGLFSAHCHSGKGLFCHHSSKTRSTSQKKAAKEWRGKGGTRKENQLACLLIYLGSAEV